MRGYFRGCSMRSKLRPHPTSASRGDHRNAVLLGRAAPKTLCGTTEIGRAKHLPRSPRENAVRGGDVASRLMRNLRSVLGETEPFRRGVGNGRRSSPAYGAAFGSLLSRASNSISRVRALTMFGKTTRASKLEVVLIAFSNSSVSRLMSLSEALAIRSDCA